MATSSLCESPASVFAASVNFVEMLQTIDEGFGAHAPPVIDKFQFELDGLLFNVRRIAQRTGQRFLITTSVGSLPFSIESVERRDAIKTIISQTHSLPAVRFAIDPAGRISAGVLFNAARTVSPDFIFYPLVLFLQEARPFLQLIVRYLHA